MRGVFVLALLTLVMLIPLSGAVPADAIRVSPQSITEFRETIPDDVLFMPGLDESNSSVYIESFSDVNDWTEMSSNGLANDEKDLLSTGDAGLFVVVFDDEGDEFVNWRTVFTTPISKHSYLEFVGYRSSTHVLCVIYALKSDLSTMVYVGSVTTGAYMPTYQKIFLGSIPGIEPYIYGLVVRIDDYPDTINNGIYTAALYYIYVYRANNRIIGWQHDCSTTDHTRMMGESDGDLIQFPIKDVSHGYESYFDFGYDRGIYVDYYPFLAINVVYDAGVEWGLSVIGDGRYEVRPMSNGTGIFRYNMRSLPLTILDSLAIYTNTYSDDYILIDWVKIYSIANYTLTQNATGLDDYLYVQDNALVSHVDTGYWQLEYDPSVNVDITKYKRYNIVLEPWSNSDYCRWYVDGVWQGDYAYFSSEDHNGTISGTTLQRFLFTTSSYFTLSGIYWIESSQWHTVVQAYLYLITPGWHAIATAIIGILVPIDMNRHKIWFILAGLVMIPASTLYLVRGGRESLSTDKIFFALLIFFVGLALFLGGIV